MSIMPAFLARYSVNRNVRIDSRKKNAVEMTRSATIPDSSYPSSPVEKSNADQESSNRLSDSSQ